MKGKHAKELMQVNHSGEPKKWRLLIVDDNETICALLSAVLNGGNCDVSFALTGDKALALLQEGRYDLCFLDLRMPDVNTIELIARIRRQAPGMKIVMITGTDPDDAAMQAIREHAVLLLIKPFDLFAIEDIVREIMDRNITSYQEYEALVARMLGEKRRHERQPFTDSDAYSLHQTGEGESAGFSRADAVDVSLSGLGIKTNIPLEPGRLVRLRGKNETLCGIVRWSAAGGGAASYRAGIQLLACNE